MSRTTSWSICLALLAPSLVLAQDTGPVVEQLSGPIPREIQAFRETQGRFEERIQEFQADTRSFIGIREQEERERISAGYDRVLLSLEEQDEQQRDLTVTRFEDFLERHGDTRYASHVRLRLAELYFDTAREEWLEASRRYFSLLEGDMTLEQMEELGDEPRIDLTEPIKLYERIAADNRDLPRDEQYEHLDAAYYMWGFCYRESNSAQFNDARGREIFAELIEVRPDSSFSDGAHLFMGNYLFDENLFDRSIAEYRLVFEKGEEGLYYVDAMYQLAWAYYKLSRYDEALDLFGRLLEHSEKELLESGRPTSYAPDAVKFMGHSLADMAERGTNEPDDPNLPSFVAEARRDEWGMVSATDVARRFFARGAPREYEWDVYQSLGEILVQYGRSDQAVQVYRYLQDDPRWVDRPENPEFQMKVAQLLGTGIDADPARAAAARLEITRLYGEGTDWWAANRNNPDALALARKYIEESLLDVAIEFHIRAQETGQPEDYGVAADKYRAYLEKFPISDDFYDQQWFLADTLFRANRFGDAEEEYESLLQSAGYHPYADGAAYRLVGVRYQQFINKIGPPDRRDPDAEVERTLETEFDRTITVYELADPHVRFIAAVDLALDREYQPPTVSNLDDYGAMIREQRAGWMYLPGQILFYANRYEEARPRLMRIIDEERTSREAAMAARLVVDSYINENDLEKVNRYTRKFRDMSDLGLDDVLEAQGTGEVLQQTLEASAYKLAVEHGKSGDYQKAVDAYLSFVEEFVDSKYLPDALLSAAINYERLGKAEKANEVFERFVGQFPYHDESRGLYARIASNYERTFELEKAIQFYDALVTNFGDSDEAVDALYNMSMLKIGLGDHIGAAQGFDKYARDYPDDPSSERVSFLAAEQYEFVSSDLAIRAYSDYLDAFGISSPTNAIRSQYRIAKLYLEQGDDRRHEQALDEIEALYSQLSDAELTEQMSALAWDHVGEAAFRALSSRHAAYVADELTRDKDEDASLLASKETELLEFVTAAEQFAGTYASFQYVTAAKYLAADSISYFAQLGLSLEPPPEFDEELQWAYWDILEEQVFPKFYSFQAQAVDRFEKLIELGQTVQRHSDWITRTYETLNELEPSTYPAQKLEISGELDAEAAPRMRPRSVDDEVVPVGTEVSAPAADSPWGQEAAPIEETATEAPATEETATEEAPADSPSDGEAPPVDPSPWGEEAP